MREPTTIQMRSQGKRAGGSGSEREIDRIE